MKILAIQNGVMAKPAIKTTKSQVKNQIAPNFITNEPNADTVAFKSKALKGFGIGAAVGVAALTFISGGLATPLAFGLYATATGTAGGMLGNILDKIDEEERDHKKG